MEYDVCNYLKGTTLLNKHNRDVNCRDRIREYLVLQYNWDTRTDLDKGVRFWRSGTDLVHPIEGSLNCGIQQKGLNAWHITKRNTLYHLLDLQVHNVRLRLMAFGLWAGSSCLATQ